MSKVNGHFSASACLQNLCCHEGAKEVFEAGSATLALMLDGAMILTRTEQLTTDIQQKKQKTLVKYYQTNLKRMRYGTFRKRGLLIGSGPIEAANRTVIQQRLKLSGQRWTITGAQQILNLRATLCSKQQWRLMDAIKIAA